MAKTKLTPQEALDKDYFAIMDRGASRRILQTGIDNMNMLSTLDVSLGDIANRLTREAATRLGQTPRHERQLSNQQQFDAMYNRAKQETR